MLTNKYTQIRNVLLSEDCQLFISMRSDYTDIKDLYNSRVLFIVFSIENAFALL